MSPETIPVQQPHPLSVGALLGEPLRTILRPAEPAIDKLFALDRLRDLYCASSTPEDLLRNLRVRFEIAEEELAAIPRTGPLLFVSNHPFGLLDAVVLAVALPRARPDLRIIANSMLSDVPELKDRCIFVDNFGRADSVAGNSSALRDCLRWLRGGGALLTFPAGEVAHWDIRDGMVADPEWSPAIVRLAQRAG